MCVCVGLNVIPPALPQCTSALWKNKLDTNWDSPLQTNNVMRQKKVIASVSLQKGAKWVVTFCQPLLVWCQTAPNRSGIKVWDKPLFDNLLYKVHLKVPYCHLFWFCYFSCNSTVLRFSAACDRLNSKCFSFFLFFFQGRYILIHEVKWGEHFLFLVPYIFMHLNPMTPPSFHLFSSLQTLTCELNIYFFGLRLWIFTLKVTERQRYKTTHLILFNLNA